MKRILAFGLLFLLLYNMFGLAVSVFLFENDFRLASTAEKSDSYKLVKFPVVTLPYSSAWENEGEVEGIFQRQGEFYNVVKQKVENDTAYITLKTNISAREKFLELADQITSGITDNTASQSPFGKAIRLMLNLSKIYWQNHASYTFGFQQTFPLKKAPYCFVQIFLKSPLLLIFSPPPQS